MKAIIVFNRSLLDMVMYRDNAKLVAEPEKLNREVRIEFICSCGNKSTKNFRMAYDKGAYCDICMANISRERQIKTFLSKYGTISPMKNDIVKEKVKQTSLEKYGVTSVLKSKGVRQKIKDTLIQHYGVDCALKSPEVRDKIKHVMLENYGTINPMKSTYIRSRFKQTMQERYGCDNALENKQILERAISSNLSRPAELKEDSRNKYKATSLIRYGVESTNQSEVVKQKKIETSLIRYGTEYPAQSEIIQEKIQKHAFRRKDYTTPSGDVRRVQGYEPYALDILLKEFTEEQIVTERKEIPRIPYIVGEKTRYYFPDIFIPHTNTIIEVKSTWTHKCKSDNVQLKAAATRAAGYTYEIWIFDGKGNRITDTTLIP